MNIGVIDKLQSAAQLRANPIPLIGLNAVPFIQSNHQRSARLDALTQQVQILLHQAFVGVHGQDHHLGIGNRLQRFDDRKLFHGLTDILAFAHPSGINERVVSAPTLVVDIDAVPGGTRLVVDHHPVLTQQSIDERRFAHVGTADNCNADGALDCWRRFFIGLF